MKKTTSIIILLLTIYCSISKAQTLSPVAIPSAGGYFTAGGNSLSWTMGEPFYTTLQNGNMLTQGFQQPYLELELINIKAFLQGLYTGNNKMNNTLYDFGFSADSTASDTIVINLWRTDHLNNAFADYSEKTILHTDGSASINILNFVPGTYYISIKHRNSLETWTPNPFNISTVLIYNFTTSAGQAYGSNQASLGDGNFALYSGDVNQNNVIDLADLSLQEIQLTAFSTGYIPSDLTGDGFVESSDYSLIENNIDRMVIRP
jgi:hypothetical protein